MQCENRRLVAIVAADIAGYSRLIGQDEEGTLRALRGHRKELIDRLIGEHGDRIVTGGGDLAQRHTAHASNHGSGGLGEAAARVLAERGTHVIVSSRKQKACDNVAVRNAHRSLIRPWGRPPRYVQR